MKINLLTVEGLEKIKSELRNLVEVQRPNIIREIQLAREQGDLSENYDYEASKAQQTVIESRIQELQEILNHYEIIQDKPTEKRKGQSVSVGNSVTLFDLAENKQVTYEIVGSFDTNPEQNKISNDSPLAKAIIGYKIGDIVEVRGIPNPYRIRIEDIR
ncbi:transcription elongation factor GreA [Mycoplasmoides fastidiosum]|uniref:Transcription elongation factor GreA n=1 Tax=Mycoplasmoides fastidiosum TaxID=92758 RepID=A0ABU0LY89_9BACT|nr:transcription elongation factor GreA [Mycoplasmoides fastidiosum]MDQ0513679.1 transcription elongation factor GreA [Mycoplasmoides fastidiosum]UUD37902.1 transcription elongation factor GreA [Mycoplasmoides fastidiosum]